MKQMHLPPCEGRRGIRHSCVSLLLFCANTAYGPATARTVANGMAIDPEQASQTLSALLTAAQDGGYSQANVLATMLTRGEITSRAVAMADAAVKHISTERVLTLCAQHGLYSAG